MKHFSLRVPDEKLEQIQAIGEELNCSTHSVFMFLVALGLKVYTGQTTTSIRLTEQKPQSRRASVHKDG